MVEHMEERQEEVIDALESLEDVLDEESQYSDEESEDITQVGIGLFDNMETVLTEMDEIKGQIMDSEDLYEVKELQVSAQVKNGSFLT